MPLNMLSAGRSAGKIMAKSAADRKSVARKSEFKRKLKNNNVDAVTGSDPSSVVRKGEFKRKKDVAKKSITKKQRDKFKSLFFAK